MAKLTPAELVDLLRKCGSRNEELCESCPYYDREDCGGDLMLDAADALASEINPKL